jgi:hypothetical protein
MDEVQTLGKVFQPCVEVVEACGEWFVRVVDEDQELTRSFELESFALAFAEGQRMRLGLDTFVRL